MQIIKLWLKLSALLAILGWAVHHFNPGFAAWVDGVFQSEPVEAAKIKQVETEQRPPTDATAETSPGMETKSQNWNFNE